MVKKGYKQTEEHIKNVIKGKLRNRGYNHSEETIQKIKKSNLRHWENHKNVLIGVPRSKEVIEKIRKNNLGKSRSEETKQKMRKPKSEQHKEHLRKPKSITEKMKKPKSKEHIKNLSVSHLEYYKNHPEKIQEYKEWRKTQVLPVKDTSIEVKIQNFLKQLNIEFFTHQYINIEHGYQCDILIPFLNMIIECYGDYWHKYPLGREIDILRCQELRGNGWKVKVFWEKEIKVMELNDFEKEIKCL